MFFQKLLKWLKLDNERGCFGGRGSPPPPPPPPAAPPPPSPAPIPTAPLPSEETASQLAEKKRRQLVAIKYGMGSTIKTSETGVGSLANLLSPTVMGMGLKEKLGL